MNDYSFPLAEKWLDSIYPLALDKLGYSKEKDSEARDQLNFLLRNQKDFDGLFARLASFKGRHAFVFGAGPSLKEDLRDLYPLVRNKKALVVAADGAADALFERMIIPDFTVSDLDSCSFEVLRAQSESRSLFVHSHGDNIETMKKIVPMLGESVLGTTQVTSKDKVINTGGLTDGDRACYIASAFEPNRVVIAGMDFGVEEGEYSKSKTGTTNEKGPIAKRKVKLELGRASLEFLIKESSSVKFYNVTRHGVRIKGAAHIKAEKLIEELS
ncbi:MAG: 6-hydroxymethylpterin diphosphokinase MptE-like protein [Nitrososphaerales archaeon]